MLRPVLYLNCHLNFVFLLLLVCATLCVFVSLFCFFVFLLVVSKRCERASFKRNHNNQREQRGSGSFFLLLFSEKRAKKKKGGPFG